MAKKNKKTLRIALPTTDGGETFGRVTEVHGEALLLLGEHYQTNSTAATVRALIRERATELNLWQQAIDIVNERHTDD